MRAGRGGRVSSDVGGSTGVGGRRAAHPLSARMVWCANTNGVPRWRVMSVVLHPSQR